MSRIEDDRTEAREIERRRLEQRQQELRVKERAVGDRAFVNKLKVHQSETDLNHSLEAGQELEEGRGRDAFRKSKGNITRAALAQQQESEQTEKDQGRQSLSLREERFQRDRGEIEAFGKEEVQVSEQSEDLLRSGREVDGQETRGQIGGRRKEANEEGDARSDRAGAGKEPQKRGMVDRDGGGKGQGGGQGSKDNDASASFRLNPALLAPPPIAKPKDSGASARLRALANEIAQKIVQRVRVGMNAAGEAEFQISLRSNILSGLDIRVAGSKGRIKAVFSGKDREVLKLLEERKDELIRALKGRGLILEELRIEATA